MMNGKLDAKLAKLHELIEQEQARYKTAVAAAVAALLSEYGLTLGDLFAPAIAPKTKAAKKTITIKPKEYVKTVKAKPAKKTKREPAFKGPQPARYQHPDGSTWSGFGRAPAWIAGVDDRTKFLIGKQAA